MKAAKFEKKEGCSKIEKKIFFFLKNYPGASF